MFVCVCVCVCVRRQRKKIAHQKRKRNKRNSSAAWAFLALQLENHSHCVFTSFLSLMQSVLTSKTGLMKQVSVPDSESGAGWKGLRT